MVKVFFTVDTEIWCDSWSNLDGSFPSAFKRYVYGPTKGGNYALPFLLETLNDHGLIGVFFVECLFSCRFGDDPLKEIVGLIQAAGQEVQLHLHTEWVDEAVKPLLPDVLSKRQFLSQFSLDEQIKLIRKGLELLSSAGAKNVNAFRSGNYALNSDTFKALAANNIFIDSSYNPASEVGVDNVMPGRILTQPIQISKVIEFPVTTYRDKGQGSLRNLQLTACSFKEIELLLNKAANNSLDSIIIVSHNFEMLNQKKNRYDGIMVRRFRKLCRFLEKNSDRFNVRGFHGLTDISDQGQSAPIQSRAWLTTTRMAEQAIRRIFG